MKRRDPRPLVEMLVNGKMPKEIAYDLGLSIRCVDYHLNRYVAESGCRTLYQAVAEYWRNLKPIRPPEGVD